MPGSFPKRLHDLPSLVSYENSCYSKSLPALGVPIKKKKIILCECVVVSPVVLCRIFYCQRLEYLNYYPCKYPFL